MVANIKSPGRMGAIPTLPRVRSVKRDRNRQHQRDPQPEGEQSASDHAKREKAHSEKTTTTTEKTPSTGQRINVII